MINDQMKQLSHSLRLFGVHEGFEKRAAQAASQGLSHLEFLRLVLEDEVLQRKDRLAKSLKTRAKFRSHANLEDWDQTFERGLAKAKLRELASLAFFHSCENVLVLGKTGEGKTHLAVSIGQRLCAEGLSVAFLPVNFLLKKFLQPKPLENISDTFAGSLKPRFSFSTTLDCATTRTKKLMFW